MTLQLIELRCSWQLARKLGAILPHSPREHREFRASGRYLLIRDSKTLLPMFWEIIDDPREGHS